MNAENEGVHSENRGVENYGRVTINFDALPPHQQLHHPWNTPTISSSDERDNRCSMGWINLIVGAHALHNFAKAYANVINDTTTFVEPNPPTNIITNESFLTQYSIKQGLKVFAQKGEASVQKN